MRNCALPSVPFAFFLLLATGFSIGANAQWTTSTLSVKRFNLSAASVGTKALFAGGVASISNPEDNFYATVDIYDDHSGLWSTASLSQPRESLASATAGDNVFFGGGKQGVLSLATVDIYNNTNSTWSTDVLSVGRQELAGVGLGGKVFFGGGYSYVTGYSNAVDIYDVNSHQWSTATLSVARTLLSAGSAGSKVLFAGGVAGSGISNVVDIYDINTHLWTTDTLSLARSAMSVVTLGTKIFFAGGQNYLLNPNQVNRIDIYDAATGHWTIDSLSQARSSLGAAATSSMAVFGGGYIPGAITDVVDIYDNMTGTWSTGKLSVGRDALVATSVGPKVIFAGGVFGPPASNIVDIFVCSGVSAGIDTAFCVGSHVELKASGGSVYSWSPAEGLSTVVGDSTAASPTTNTHYTVASPMTFGCIARATVEVVVNNLPSVTVTAPLSICKGDSTSLTASGAAHYIWSPDQGLSSVTGATIQASPSETTNYIVEGTDIHQCKNSATTSITINHTEKPTITSSGDDNSTLTSSAADGNQWYKDGLIIAHATTPTLTVTETGMYAVAVTANGCISELSDAVHIVITGLAESGSSALTIFPNPASSQVAIRPAGFEELEAFDLKVVDLLGRTVLQRSMHPNGFVDISSLSTGVYFVQASQSGKLEIGRLMKK